MARPYEIFHSQARGILSKTSGFIAESGFTHSLTPARNCTYGCTYCYVPTMGLYGGLKPEDWQRWGQFTTYKTNAAELLAQQLRPEQLIYCSPLVDPYQPSEEEERSMPAILDALIARPPRVFTVQTRGVSIVRDLDRLLALSAVTKLRISFSVTTNRDEVRRRYEPHCESYEERIRTIAALRAAGLEVYMTLAPILPCDPEVLAEAALSNTDNDVIGDPLHVREVKRSGATTREAARRISEKHGEEQWFDPQFQADVSRRIGEVIRSAGRRFGTGPEGFSWLAQN